MYQFNRSRLLKVTDEEWSRISRVVSPTQAGSEHRILTLARAANVPTPVMMALMDCLAMDGRADLKLAVYHCQATNPADVRFVREGFPGSNGAPWTCPLCKNVLGYAKGPNSFDSLRYDPLVAIFVQSSI
jgi:hypothetical protein